MEEDINLRNFDINTLLEERNQYLETIKILKTQLLNAGITPYSPHTKSAPDLTRSKRLSLPIYPTAEVSESDNVRKTHRYVSCNMLKQSLSTYDKRSGTNDLGKQYEYIMCGYYAIRFAISEQVSDFEMTTNDEVYGDFDDIAIKVKYENGNNHTYLLQLKHTENKKGLSEKILSAEKKDFSLMKYLKTYQNLKERDNVSCILFTNRTAQFKELSQFSLNCLDVVVKQFDDVEYEKLLDTNQTTRKSVFQLSVPDCDNSDEIVSFLKQFYLFANQNNVSKMKTLITENLKNLLKCDVYDSFIHFMKNWWCGNFILTKNDVIVKLAELALSPSIRTISNYKTTKNSEILEAAIMKFDMTIAAIDTQFACYIWNPNLDIREVSLTALKYGLTNRGISHLNELTFEQKSKVLWYLDQAPLVVKVYDSRRKAVKCAIKLLETLSVKKKIILLGDYSKLDFPNWLSFENLSDLKEDKLYEDIIENFQISLQGREPILLKTLINSSEKSKIISVKELFLMTQNPLLVGEKKFEFPEFYIPRTVTTTFLNTEKVIYHTINCNELLIIISNQNLDDYLTSINIPYFRLQDFDKNCEISVILTTNCTKFEFDTICRKTPKLRVHMIKVIDSQSSILVSSSENTLKSEDLKNPNKPIAEIDIHKIFDSPINVLCAQPGIGKSTMIKFLDTNCPVDYWNVRVNLRKFNSLLKEEPEEEEILLHFLELDEASDDCLLYEIKAIFLESRKIYLFLDGLDEIESNCVDFALDYVRYIASTGIHVWISSRQNLQEIVINQLNIFPIDIQELNQQEQLNYIEQRLKNRYESDEIQEISKEIFQSADLANSHNMLGIPLQLFVITENFLDDDELYDKLNQEVFVLTKMYKIFFDGKKKHLYEKVGVQYEQQLGFNFHLYLENYEIPALKTCLDKNAYQRLNLDDSRTDEFIETIKAEGDKFGIISQINEDRAVFTHQTYAEYFACVWFKKNFTKARILKDEFKSKKYQNLKLIFDIMLAENCPLHLAVIYLNFEQVKIHLADINSTDEGGRTALHLICSYGKKCLPLQIQSNMYSHNLFYDENNFSGETSKYQEIFNLLSHCNPFLTDEVFKWNSLEYCFHFQCLYAVEKFLEQYGDKIKIDQIFKNINNVSLVYYSAKLGYPRILEAVIKRNKNVIHFRIGESKLSFLHVTVKGIEESQVTETTKIQIIRILKQNGIDINIKDINGATALLWAASQSSYQLVKTLLDEEADINASDNREETIIHYSVQEWDKQVKLFKVDTSENNVTARDQNCNTILHWASKENDYDLLEKLITKVDVNSTNKFGETPLHFAVRAWKPNPKVIHFLIKNGADVNLCDSFGITPLHWAFNRGLYKIIEILHQNGTDSFSISQEHKIILSNSYKPLKPNMKILEMLMDYGFDVNFKNSSGVSILHWVCEKGHLELVKLLITNGANVNATTENQETILHFISKGWNTKLVKIFTEIGGNINYRDINGITALHRAAERGHLEMVEILIDEGADTQATSNHGETVLIYAVKSENPNLEVIKFLILKGIDVNSKDQDGVTALHWASEKGHYSVVKLLLQEGANINSTTRKGETPLHYTNPESEIIKLLIENNVSVNATDIDGMTALHWASERGQFDLVKILLDNDANVNAATTEEETILIYTVKKRKINPEIIKLLINHGADMAAIDKNGMTALHWACNCGHYEAVKLLLEKGVDVNLSTNKKENTLHYASKSWQPNIEIIKRLVLVGVDINFQDGDGCTPLHWACKEGHYMNVETLIDLGADFNILASNRESALHFAAKAWKINDSVLELLIEKGINVDSVDRDGKTALHCASEKGFYDNVKFLIDKGANLDLATNHNLTALHFAVYAGHVKIIKLLIGEGLKINKIAVKNVSLPLYFATRNGHLREDLLIMMAATIRDKFPLLSLNRYSNQEVITYLQEAQPYLESPSLMRNASTSMSDNQPNFFRSYQNLVVTNIRHSWEWFTNTLNSVICRKASRDPCTPTFIVHYPVFPTDIFQNQEVKTPTNDRAYTF